MESELIATLDDIANKAGVKGVLLADEEGFCLGARGVAKPESAAFISSIAQTAAKINNTQEQESTASNSRYPTIKIDYENYNVIIRSEGDFTLAVFG